MPNALLPIAWHPGTWELIVMLLIILVLFGSRLPKVARSLGQGISEFKKGINDKVDEKSPPEDQGGPRT